MTAGHRVPGRRARIRSVAIVAAVAVVAAWAPITAAHADEHDDDPPPTVAVENIDVVLGPPPVIGQPPQIQQTAITIEGDFVTTVTPVSSGCHQTPSQSVCLGSFVDPDQFLLGQTPITVQGGFVERTAIDWITEEAEQFLAAVYDVPRDDRLRVYAAAEIRAYVVNRILQIIDKAAYNQPLTTNEQKALDTISREILDADKVVPVYAYEEFQRFKASPCTYSPPPAPAFVPSPVGIPTEVDKYCNTARSRLMVAFEYMPPQPSESHFTTWAVYRHMNELGMGNLDLPALQQNMAGTLAALTLGGTALAVGAYFATAGIVGMSLATATSVLNTLAPFAIGGIKAAAAKAAAATGAAVATKPLIIGAGAALAAGAAAIIVAALIITAISIWMFAEYQQVGANLSAAANRAAGALDPFGLVALKAANQGKAFREGMTADNLPAYRSDTMVTRITEAVTRWMSVGSGGVQPDATGVWEPNNTSPVSDWAWEITTPEGTTTGATLRYPKPLGEGPGTVRFDRGWMVVDDLSGDTPRRGALQFEYEDPSGDTISVARRGDGKLLLTRVEFDQATKAATYHDPVEADEITLVDPVTEETVTARLRAPGPGPLAGPRPTVAGSLVPGGLVHNLRPNPVDTNGHFDLTRFRDDYDYEWELERFDEASQDWVPVALLPQPIGQRVYGAKFLPTHAGTHRAHVTMTSIENPTAPARAGVVDFEIRPPDITFVEANVANVGLNDVRVDLLLAQDTGVGAFDVKVRWPGRLGSDDPRPETNLSIDCLQSDFAFCDTPFTADIFPYRQALTHQVGPLSDLSQGVEVTVTNQHGRVVTRTLDVDLSGRPHFVEAPPPTLHQDGSVVFDTNIIHVQVPVQGPSNYFSSPNYRVADIVPGPAENPFDRNFILRNPTTDAPVQVSYQIEGNPRLGVSVETSGPEPRGLIVRAVPNADDVGTYIVPIEVMQSNGQRATVLLHLDVVPAPDEKYRAFLDVEDATTVLPARVPGLDPMVVGGRADWEPYDDEICFELDVGFSARQTCGGLEDYRDADGDLVFPWLELAPHGLGLSVSYRPRVWLADTGRSWPVAHEYAFFSRTNAPVIDGLTRDDATGDVTLEVSDPNPTDAFEIDGVTCTLDDVVVDECFESGGGTWNPGELPDGDHVLRVVVTDTFGNWNSETLEFTTGPRTVTYVASYRGIQCSHINTFASALGITPAEMIKAGVNGFRSVAEAGQATPASPTPPPAGEPDCTFEVTWDASEQAALEAAADAWGVSVDDLHSNGGWLVVVLIYIAIVRGG